jgi:hypothetical protein
MSYNQSFLRRIKRFSGSTVVVLLILYLLVNLEIPTEAKLVICSNSLVG